MKKEEIKKKVQEIKKNQETTKKKNRGGAGDGLFFDSKSKTWGFRAVRDGKDNRRKGFKTKTEAKEARILFLANYEDNVKEQEKEVSMTFQQVFDHYLTYGAADKREKTIEKHKSLWRCHVQRVFAEKEVSKVSAGEINNYLLQLYTQGDEYNDFKFSYAYGTVEGVLKFFYLFYGYSRRMGWITREKYEDMCEVPKMRIDMPKKQKGESEEGEIETYTQEEIERMRNRIKESSLYVAFEIGVYCGLRISECFGLMWCDIDFNKKTMRIERQMQKSGVHRVLVPVKTEKANRTIDIPDKLLSILKEHKQKQEEDAVKYGDSYKNKETVRVRMKLGQDDPLTSGDFINRMPDGTLLSSDSMKSWRKKILSELDIYFKYHNLRHTHASRLAALNMPLMALMDRMGHSKIETTRKYYIGQDETAQELTKRLINTI